MKSWCTTPDDDAVDSIVNRSSMPSRPSHRRTPRPSTTGETPQPVGYKTTVTMEFTGLEDGRTLVTISESGWRQTPGGLKSSYGNCEGWTGMLCGMKVYLEHGINFRTGFYK